MIVKQRRLLYKPSMALKTDKDIRMLSPEPGVTVWYCQIHNIIHSVFSKGNYHNFSVAVNKLFKKDDFAHPFISGQEIEIINSFKSMKKQIEWICGRYLLKKMFTVFFSKQKNALDEISIAYRSQGAPYFKNNPDLPISLSHSNEYTAAAICETSSKKIGIDIEKIQKEPSDNFLKIGFTRKEIHSMAGDTLQIFTNWTIKEAYLKYIQKGFNESLHHVEIFDDTVFHNQAKIDLTVYSKVIDKRYILSLVSG